MAGDEIAWLRAQRAEMTGTDREPEWRRDLVDAILRRCTGDDVPGGASRADLDEAADHAGWLLAHDCGQWSFSLVGRAHEVRWEAFGDLADRDVAITMLSEADDLRSENAWFSAADHAALGELLLSRHADRGVPYDLDLAIDRLRAALDGCDDDERAALYLRYRLGTALALRAGRRNTAGTDRRDAANLLARALPHLPEGDPATQETALTLGRLLQGMEVDDGDAGDLDETVEWTRRILGEHGLAILRAHSAEAVVWTVPDDPLHPSGESQ
ncbi:hypothetical protein AB0M44_18605 [Streptosporangium subroseum]|uniref:hypothetical protein n=1 Tax=Streptosporangium subroseum TaxID=106412 RepID=UPI00341A3C4E